MRFKVRWKEYNFFETWEDLSVVAKAPEEFRAYMMRVKKFQPKRIKPMITKEPAIINLIGHI